MNDKQKKVLIITGLVILAMLLYPPIHVIGGRSGYDWIFASHTFYDRSTVNIGMLMTQWLAAIIIGGIAFLVFKDR